MNWYDDPTNFPALIQITSSVSSLQGKLFIAYSCVLDYGGKELTDGVRDGICSASEAIFIDSIANVAPEALI